VNASPVSTEPGPDADAIGGALCRLGDCLREARLSQGIELGQLAGQLRMGEEQLEALELGDSNRLPELVFVVAQARRVATSLGVDINPLVEPLKQAGFAIKPAPAPLTASEAKSEEHRPARLTARQYTLTKANERRPKLGRRIGGLALVAGLISGGVWGWQQRQIRPASTPPPAAAPAAKPKPAKKTMAVRTVPAQPRSLSLSSPQPSWVEVRSLAGQQLFIGTLKGRRNFPLGSGLRVLAGRPDLVTAQLGEAEGKPLGRIDQINWVTFKPPGAAPVRPVPAR